jgi:hypothetical protein
VFCADHKEAIASKNYFLDADENRYEAFSGAFALLAESTAHLSLARGAGQHPVRGHVYFVSSPGVSARAEIKPQDLMRFIPP